MNIPAEIRRWVTLGVIVVAVMMTVAFCQIREANKRLKSERTVAVATGKALDRVAEQTPIIRDEQERKQDEVQALPGADQRLPDGFGRDLQCVRKRDRDCYSR